MIKLSLVFILLHAPSGEGAGQYRIIFPPWPLMSEARLGQLKVDS